jgi:DNA-binding SARP family transcriptional activator
MFKLRTLGGLSLESDTTPLPLSATQRRRLALLAVLACAKEVGFSREKLIGYLWPESSEERARHALEQLLYATRRDLGRESVLSVSGRLRLNPEVVNADVVDFEAALVRGSLDEAVSSYTGPFLDGVYLGGAPEFERWVESERAQLQERYAAVLEKLAGSAVGSEDHSGAIRWWRRLAALDPLSTPYAAGLIRALAAAGDPAGALRQVQVHRELVRESSPAAPACSTPG